MKVRQLSLTLEQLKSLKDLVIIELGVHFARNFRKVIEENPTKTQALPRLVAGAVTAYKDCAAVLDAVNVWAIQMAARPKSRVLMSVDLYDLLADIVQNRPWDAIPTIDTNNDLEAQARDKLVAAIPALAAAFKGAELVDFDFNNPFTAPKKTPPPLLN